MRVLHVSQTDYLGGAAIAAYRIHKALVDTENINSIMCCDTHHSTSYNERLPSWKYIKIESAVRKKIDHGLKHLMPTAFNTSSINIVPSSWLKKINDHNPDVVHLHRLGGQMLSINQIAKIKAPIVWTLHDYWALNGISHLSQNDAENNTNLYIRAWLQIDQLLKRYKKNLFFGKIKAFVVPSNFAKKTLIDKYYINPDSIKVIPIPMFDIDIEAPVFSRSSIRRFTILYSAIAADLDKNKGLDDFIQALQIINCELADLNIEINVCLVGFDAPDLNFDKLNIDCRGYIENTDELFEIYKQADICVMPSLNETFGQVALEVQRFGVPVIYYYPNGMDDIVIEGKTGYAIEAGDYKKIAKRLCQYVRDFISGQGFDTHKISGIIQKKFSSSKVSHDYKRLYFDVSEK